MCTITARLPHPFSSPFVPSFKEGQSGKSSRAPERRDNGNMKRKASSNILFSFLVIFYKYFVCLNLFLNFIGVQAFCHFFCNFFCHFFLTIQSNFTIQSHFSLDTCSVMHFLTQWRCLSTFFCTTNLLQ